MSEVELNLTVDNESARSNFVKHPTVWNQKVIRYLDLISSIESERDQLRQQFEAAEGKVKMYKGLSEAKGSGIAAQSKLLGELTQENIDLKEIIRQAQEQKPYAVVSTHGIAPNGRHANWLVPFDQVEVGVKLYAVPVPAMPIQDDRPAVFPELVEAVTKAILFQDSGSTQNWEDNTDIGEAALKAISGDWQVVPTHITTEMRINAWEAAHKLSPNIKNTLNVLWEQLLNAAPKSEVKPS